MIFIKPLDEKLLHKIFKKYDEIITIEDGAFKGDLAALFWNLLQTIIIKTIFQDLELKMNLFITEHKMSSGKNVVLTQMLLLNR